MNLLWAEMWLYRFILQCLECPAGFSCIDRTLPPILCEEGYYSPQVLKSWAVHVLILTVVLLLQGDPLCRVCPRGYTCSDEEMSLCSPGYYSQEGSSECTLCSPGQACPLPFTKPMPCVAGQHTDGESGAVVCQDCPPGYFCPDPKYVHDVLHVLMVMLTQHVLC